LSTGKDFVYVEGGGDFLQALAGELNGRDVGDGEVYRAALAARRLGTRPSAFGATAAVASSSR
jgi:hypothetical protein